MDTRTGNILSPELMELLGRAKSLSPKEKYEQAMAHLKEMQIPPTPEQQQRGRVGRNDPCPCRSGKKFKHCCFKPVHGQ